MVTTSDVLDAIHVHAQEAYPEECCGFLLGRVSEIGNEITSVSRAANRQAEFRERRYQISPQDYHAAERRASSQGLDVVGFYHSHPDHPAQPSETDLREATFPGFTYVIASVSGGEGGEITAWSLAADRSRFKKEEISIVDALRTP